MRPVGGNVGWSTLPSDVMKPDAAEPSMSKPPRDAHGPLDP
jgi:hypothetical protein